MKARTAEIFWWPATVGLMLGAVLNGLTWTSVDPRPSEVPAFLLYLAAFPIAGPPLYCLYRQRRRERQARRVAGLPAEPRDISHLFPTISRPVMIAWGVLTLYVFVAFVFAFVQQQGDPEPMGSGYVLITNGASTPVSFGEYISQIQLQNRIVTGHPTWAYAIALMALHRWRHESSDQSVD